MLTRTLGEICDEVDGIIQTGPFGSQLHQSDYQETGTPVVMPKDLVEGKVSTDNIARIGTQDVERLSRHELEKGDIVYARRGDIGRRALITSREAGWMCGTGCMRISLGDTVIHPVFLHYYLGQPNIVAWIYNQAIGATMPNLNTSIIRSIPVTYPPLPIQRRIAGILSAYDDLIENNTRRIAILEEMARLIYQEWFVRYRFPGHEDVEMVESEMGMVPEGWEVKEISDVVSYLNRGISPKYDERSESIVINQKCIRDNRLNMTLSRRHSTRVPSEKYVQFGDILINSTGEGTLGRVTQVYQDLSNCTVDSHVTIVRPGNAVSVDYFGFYLVALQPYFSAMGFGATNQTELGRNTIARTGFLLPPKDLQSMFSEIIAPLRKNIISLSDRSTNLRRTRDLLLPRLVSGEVEV